MDIQELISEINSNNRNSNIHGKTITSTRMRIVIESSVSEKEILFNDVEFDRDVVFKNLNIKGSIRFKDCKFKGSIQFDNCKIKLNPDHRLNESLSFEVCNFNANNFIISSLSDFDSMVIIDGCININNFYVQNSTFNSMFHISKSSIDVIDFSTNNFTFELRYEDSKLNGQIRHSENRYNSLVIMNCEFKKDLFFKDNFIENNIALNDSIFNDSITIDYFNESGDNSALNIYNSTFLKEATIKYYTEYGDEYIIGGCRNIYIDSNICYNGIDISGCHEMLNLDYLKKLHINLSEKFEGLIKIQDLGIDDFIITGGNYRGNVVLNNLTINSKLFIHNFLNYSNFQFINISRSTNATHSQFQILESYLEKFQFINCKLDNFQYYLIYNSNISQIKSSNTFWFNYFDLSKLSNQTVPSFYNLNSKVKKIKISTEDFQKNIRETFRQLKFAMENQGDRFTSLVFRSYEYKAAYSDLKKVKVKNFNDWMIMSIGRVNDFGQCWWKPLLIWLGFNFLIYISLIINTYPTGNFSEINYIKYHTVYVQLLNPLHYIDKVFIKPLVINDGTYWLDYISRIISGFFIFEIISAFRKYIK